MASISKRVRMENYDELRLENQLLRQRMDKLEKYIHGLDRAVSRKRQVTSDFSSTDDALSFDPPKRKRYKRNRSKKGKSFKCSKCDENFKSFLSLAKHKCTRSTISNQRFSSTKIPKTATRLNSSSALTSSSSSRSNSLFSSTKKPGPVYRHGLSSLFRYEMSSISDPFERIDFSDPMETTDSTENSMDGYETAHSINSSDYRSSLSAINETDESCYETAASSLSDELQMDGLSISNSSSESFERPCSHVRLPENLPNGLSAIEKFSFAVDSLFDLNNRVPVIRNANFSVANNSRIIKGIVYDRNLTMLSSHPPTFVEQEFELPTYVRSKTPFLSEIEPIWPTAVELYEDSTSSHSSSSMPSNADLFESDSVSTVQGSFDEHLSPFINSTKQISKKQTSTSESEFSQETHSTADSGMDSLDFGETTYRSIFSSTYLITEVERIAKTEKEFSIFKFLPLTIKMAVCECCLCCIRQNNDHKIEISDRFCICMDPFKRKCNEKYSGRKRNSVNKNSNRSCENCLLMMVTLSKMNHQTKFIKCGMVSCYFTAKQPSKMKEHYKKHLNIRNFECLICQRSFQTKSILRKHGRSHLNSSTFSFSNSSSSGQSS